MVITSHGASGTDPRLLGIPVAKLSAAALGTKRGGDGGDSNRALLR